MAHTPLPPRSPRWLLPLLLILFFGSGACALVYQVMWLRLLALVFGVTVYAASTVLAGFMAGLGVGSLVAGRLAARVKRPLAAFGIAEVLVGVTAFLSPLVLDALAQGWQTIQPSLPDSVRDRNFHFPLRHLVWKKGAQVDAIPLSDGRTGPIGKPAECAIQQKWRF